MVNIKDLGKAEVLKTLWEHSHTQGMSFLGLLGLENGVFTIEHARELVESNSCLYFDYVDGHVIKCNITGDEFDESLYERDCGEGSALKAIEYVEQGKLNEIDVVPSEFEILGEIIKSMAEKNNK